MANSQAPEVSRFTYCLLPAEGQQPVVEKVFDGSSDQELRDGIAAYFSGAGLTEGQRQEFSQNMQHQVAENSKKGQVGTAPPPPTDAALTDQFIQQAMSRGGSFEIVPVIYPDSTNGYRSVSLYIDQIGRFKDLPLNERASKMSQRDIRGDAFVISSYDDPVKDSWARVDLPKSRVEELIVKPPEAAQDPTARAAAMQSSIDTKAVTPEDAAKAQALKDSGNALFQKGTYDGALQSYTEAIGLLSGRLDDVNAAECQQMLLTLHLNRAQAHLKAGSLREAEQDCTVAVTADPTSVKAWYRRASARRLMKEYDAALSDLANAKAQSPSEQSVLKLIDQIEAERIAFKKQEKAKFSKLFG
eukprot:TRINITY_DN13094_c0_g1_i1.p1 TRINITY_DN13094_c0_g1~~TRINITY_DN13094_c0_g1_i1.p1  ORF type:complete len:382 (+),score=165.51 TRINITY_DN13094_c0_g1_i1:74-1147(+)